MLADDGNRRLDLGVRSEREDHGGRAARGSASARSSSVVILRLRALSGTSRTTAAGFDQGGVVGGAEAGRSPARRPAPEVAGGTPAASAPARARRAEWSARRGSGSVGSCPSGCRSPAPRRSRHRRRARGRLRRRSPRGPRTAGPHRAPARCCSRREGREPGGDRVGPLATAGDDQSGAGAARETPAACSACAAARTTTTRATSGWQAKGRRARSSTGTPARGRNCLGTSPPRRLPCPAATTTTPTSRGKRPHQLLDVVEGDQRDAGDL